MNRDYLVETLNEIKERRSNFLKGAKGGFRNVLSAIWDEIVIRNNKEVIFSVKSERFRKDLEKRGFTCELGYSKEARKAVFKVKL